MDLMHLQPPYSAHCGLYDHDWQTIQRYKDGLVTKRCKRCKKRWTYQQELKEASKRSG